MTKGPGIYGGLHPWEVPAYTLPVAAWHVRVPAATLRYWVAGRDWVDDQGRERHAMPIIHVPRQNRFRFLSFVNLIEAHVLASMRRRYELPMHKIRTALTFIAREFDSKHPLATETFRTDGVDLFIDRMNRLISVDKTGQGVIKETLAAGLLRIGYEDGNARQLFPFTRVDEDAAQPKLVVIDSRIAFGRPVIYGTGIPVEEVAERFDAGDSSEVLTEEFGLDRMMVEEAVRAAHVTARRVRSPRAAA